jgi:hypothetical protein
MRGSMTQEAIVGNHGHHAGIPWALPVQRANLAPCERRSA